MKGAGPFRGKGPSYNLAFNIDWVVCEKARLNKMKNMRSGLVSPDGGLSLAVKELLYCFIAIFNRQCISKAFLYMFHNGLESAEDFNAAIIKGLKYGSLSQNGVGAKLKPHLQLAFSQGFLTKKDCRDSPYAERALELYIQVHSAWQNGGEDQVKLFVEEYAMSMLEDPAAIAQEALLAGDVDEEEAEVIANDTIDEALDAQGEGSEEEEEDDEEPLGKRPECCGERTNIGFVDECECDVCTEMRAFDELDMDSLHSDDPLENLMISGLRNALSMDQSVEK